MEETDVSNYFQNNICDFFFNPINEKHGLAKAPTKNLLQSSCSNLAIWRHNSVISSENKLFFSRENWVHWSTVWATFSKFWSSEKVLTDSITETQKSNKINKVKRKSLCSIILLRLWKSGKISFGCRSDLETTHFSSFRPGSLSYTVISPYLLKASILINERFVTSTGIDITLQTGVK